MTAIYQQKAYEQLYALAQTMSTYDGLTATLRDNRVEVIRPASPQAPRETITCAPRPSDGDRLWFYDSHRKPIGEADQVVDTAMHVARALTDAGARAE